VPRTLVARAADYPAGHDIPRHRHERAQLVHAARGVMTVIADVGRFVIPPGRALWVPAGVEHSIRVVQAMAMRTVYVDPLARADFPPHCAVVTVSPLLRELILAAMSLPRLYDAAGPQGRLVEVLLDQLRTLEQAPLHLPEPRDRRARRVARQLARYPADQRSLSAWAKHGGTSVATLGRLFRDETGMSFGAWRQQLRLVAALELLGQDRSVTAVALELGYRSVSAFVAMFRRSLGTTPAQYFRNPGVTFD
jgi:AraC-like DNA-binding protein